MARRERVVVGTQAQVLAAAYESVVMRGIFVEDFDPYRSQFSFREYHQLGVVLDVVVAARAVDDAHTRVVVTARDEARFGNLFRLDRRARSASSTTSKMRGRSRCEPWPIPAGTRIPLLP